jgi:hypothetical protein
MLSKKQYANTAKRIAGVVKRLEETATLYRMLGEEGEHIRSEEPSMALADLTEAYSLLSELRDEVKRAEQRPEVKA